MMLPPYPSVFPLLQTLAPVGCPVSCKAQNSSFSVYGVGEEEHSECVCPKTSSYIICFELIRSHLPVTRGEDL